MQIILSSFISRRHYHMTINIVEKDGFYSIIKSIDYGKENSSYTEVEFTSLEDIKNIYLNTMKEKIVDGSSCKIILYKGDNYHILELKENGGKYCIFYRNEYIVDNDCNTGCASSPATFEEAKGLYFEDIEGLIFRRIK